MTKEQQKEVLKILKVANLKIDDEGWISENADIYTDEIDKLREQGARIYYCCNEGQMRISNWNPTLRKEPKKPKESVTRMEVRGFRNRAKIELVKKSGESEFSDHDHIHLIVDGKDLGYMHVLREQITWWPSKYRTLDSEQAICLVEDC